jgi:hypothetical protein
MDAITETQQAVLDVLDEHINKLERRLAKVQPLIDELNKLKQTRMTLLSVRGVTSGGVRNGTKLTMESVIQAMRDHDETTVNAIQLSQVLGVDPTVIRSHLNRYKDERYEQVSRGEWRLIGENTEDASEDEDEDDE